MGLLDSLAEIVSGIINLITSLIQTVLNTISGVFSLAGTTVKEGTHATGNVIDFLLSNIIPIGVVIAALVGFSAYQQSRGRAVQGSALGKKRV